jgi:NitT/TauT family transport system permease protein
MSLMLKRIVVLIAAIAALEVLCRFGWIDRMTMIPPSEMVDALWAMLRSGSASDDIQYTLDNMLAAIVLSVTIGFVAGTAIHAVPRLRSVLDPLLASYYAVPIFVFYPLLIVLFGITNLPLIIIGAMFGVVAMIVNTLTGLDRVPRAFAKSARLFRLGRIQELYLVSLPSTGPHFITGLKFSIVYSVIGVIAGEFILSSRGIGYRIAFAYNNFDTRAMYALMLLLIGAVTIVTLTLHAWEKRLHRRWGRE